jgi:hypothetical protein
MSPYTHNPRFTLVNSHRLLNWNFWSHSFAIFFSLSRPLEVAMVWNDRGLLWGIYYPSTLDHLLPCVVCLMQWVKLGSQTAFWYYELEQRTSVASFFILRLHASSLAPLLPSLLTFLSGIKMYWLTRWAPDPYIEMFNSALVRWENVRLVVRWSPTNPPK